jgi:hypothetical protein
VGGGARLAAARGGEVTAPPAPLASGRPFNVAFDGDVLTGTIAVRTVRDLERLIKVLNAQKAAMEAMQEDDGEDHDTTSTSLSLTRCSRPSR